MIAHVAHLEHVSIAQLEGRYTPDQIGLLYYMDRKRRAQEYDFSAKLVGQYVAQTLSGLFA